MNKTTNCNIRVDRNYDVYCGRGSGVRVDPILCKPGEYGWLGNPVKIGEHCRFCSKPHPTAGSTLECYEIYPRSCLMGKPEFREEFKKLQGKKLGCFCKPGPCHTDVMIKYLDNGLIDDLK